MLFAAGAGAVSGRLVVKGAGGWWRTSSGSSCLCALADAAQSLPSSWVHACAPGPSALHLPAGHVRNTCALGSIIRNPCIMWCPWQQPNGGASWVPSARLLLRHSCHGTGTECQHQPRGGARRVRTRHSPAQGAVQGYDERHVLPACSMGCSDSGSQRRTQLSLSFPTWLLVNILLPSGPLPKAAQRASGER